jgi:DNA polymerase V
VDIDFYGRHVPRPAHGTANLPFATSSATLITNAILQLYDHIVNHHLLVRRITIGTYNVTDEGQNKPDVQVPVQLDLYTDTDKLMQQKKETDIALSKERKMQEALLSIKNKYGKNAILKGLNFESGATARERNRQIGGHKA